MAIAVITEKAVRQPMQTDATGPRRARAWEIYATSEQAAFNLLYSGDTNSPGVKRGTPFVDHQGESYDPRMVCHTLTARGHPPALAGGSGLYEVRALYGYSRYAASQPKPPLPPSVEDPNPCTFRIETSMASVLVDHDIYGFKITNSVDEPIDPPLAVLEPREMLIAEWVRQYVSWWVAKNTFRSYKGKTNSAPWAGYPAQCLLCHDISATETDLPTLDNPYFRMVGRWEIRPEKEVYGETYAGWTHTPLNRGRRIWTGEYNEAGDRMLVQATDAKGVPYSDPIFLTAAGEKLPDDEDPYVLAFANYWSTDFNRLRLPVP